MNDQGLVNALRTHLEAARKIGLYPGKSGIWAVIEQASDRIEAQATEIDALRNELCLKCGNYTLAHEGACDGCRWRR